MPIEPDPAVEARLRCRQAARILDAIASGVWPLELETLERVRELVGGAAAWAAVVDS